MMEDMKRSSVLHERVNILKDQGYRGFHLAGGRGKLENAVEVKAENKKGVSLTAQGDTLDEAYENLIERIDYWLDD